MEGCGGRRTGYAGLRARDPRSERRGTGIKGHSSLPPPPPPPRPRPPRPPVSQPSEWRVAPRACRAAQNECPNLSGPWLCHLWKERWGLPRHGVAAGRKGCWAQGTELAGRHLGWAVTAEVQGGGGIFGRAPDPGSCLCRTRGGPRARDGSASFLRS